MKYKVIGIRADADARIGMGHLMRCMSIAIALHKEHVRTVFVTNREQTGHFLVDKGFVCCKLEREYACMDDELPELVSLLRAYRMDLLLVDSYQATERYLGKLNEVCPVFYMDDLGRMGLSVSGLINYNIYGQDMEYEAAYSKDTCLLLGSLYAPVKPEFLQTAYTVKGQVRDILITMGGSDALNIAGQLGKRLLQELPDTVRLTIICGRFSPHLQQVRELADTQERVRVLTDIPDMWNYMAECDIAIAAAGSTLYELCTMGVPTVCCYYVENQRRAAQSFGEKTAMKNAGDFSVDPQQVIENIICEVQDLSKAYTARLALSEELRKLCDGQGAERIACKIINLSEKEVG